jgi:hypothetical protein
MFSPDLASPKRPGKVRSQPDSGDYVASAESGQMPSLGDDDSIKEDCDGNEAGVAIIKGPWAAHEDKMLRSLVEEFGAKRWSSIAAKLPGRIGKQARLAPRLITRGPADLCAHCCRCLAAHPCACACPSSVSGTMA